MPSANDAAISGVVTTAPSGCPLPIGFPSVTMSGTTPWVSKPHMWLPTRAKPIWISSAMHTAPFARASSYAAAKYPSGGSIWPPHEMMLSARKADAV